MPDPDARFDRILVVCTRQIGDVLLTTPMIRAARQRWPDARIDVLGFAGTLGMLHGNPDVHALVEVPSGGGWRSALPLVRRLWRRYDLALITQRSDRAFLYGWVAARVRSGFVSHATAAHAWRRRVLQAESPATGETEHMVTEKISLLAPWCAAPARIEVVAPPGAPLPADIEAALQTGCVVVHVPSMWRYKQWPVAHYRDVVAALLAEGRQVVLTGGAGEGDRALVAELHDLGAAPHLLDVAGRLDLNQLAGLLRRAALFIGPDTSITHLAAAAGTPVVALFGPTDPRIWGPWPQGAAADVPYFPSGGTQVAGRTVLLQGHQPCVPCFREGCERHRGSRSDCLESISAQRVIDVARAVLAGQPSV